MNGQWAMDFVGSPGMFLLAILITLVLIIVVVGKEGKD